MDTVFKVRKIRNSLFKDLICKDLIFSKLFIHLGYYENIDELKRPFKPSTTIQLAIRNVIQNILHAPVIML